MYFSCLPSFIFFSVFIKDILVKYFFIFEPLIYICQKVKKTLILRLKKDKWAIKINLFLKKKKKKKLISIRVHRNGNVAKLDPSVGSSPAMAFPFQFLSTRSLPLPAHASKPSQTL